MPTSTIKISDKCSELVIKTSGDPITTVDDRNNGSQVSFMQFTYGDYTMRRKAEVLKYKTQVNISKRTYYSYLSRTGFYSQGALKNSIDNKTIDCNVPSTASASGVIGSNAIYYLDPKVPYYKSI
jgi:hypothetical protein